MRAYEIEANEGWFIEESQGLGALIGGNAFEGFTSSLVGWQTVYEAALVEHGAIGAEKDPGLVLRMLAFYDKMYCQSFRGVQIPH
jgi:hypothetical protein